MVKVSLAKATEELHNAKLHAEDWNHTLAMYTTRVARLEAELAGIVPPLPKVKAAPAAVAFEKLAFPPMNVPITKATK